MSHILVQAAPTHGASNNNNKAGGSVGEGQEKLGTRTNKQ